MEVLTGQYPDTKPLPATDAISASFFEAASQGRLLFQQCAECGHRQFYPRGLCTSCGATPEWAEASGRGTIHTFTVVRQYGAEPYKSELPYVVAVIELDEGVRMMGNVTGIDPDEIRIGLSVEAYALLAEEKIAIPYWRPASEA
jgi:uncharacterized OB-fold protein